jgi:hypothetical protein
MQLFLFEEDWENTNKRKTKRKWKNKTNISLAPPVNKKQKHTLISLATNYGLAQFLCDDKIDIRKAWDNWYIDEIKALFLSWVRDLKKYEKCRIQYKQSIIDCIKYLELTYFTQDDVSTLDNFFSQTQQDIKNLYGSFDNQQKNDYIFSLIQENPYLLWSVWNKIDPEHKAALLMSLYNSYIHSQKVDIKQRLIRYNRLFFQHQLEYKKIYHPYGRMGNKNWETLHDIIKKI